MPSKILDLPGSINSKSAETPLITLTVLLKASWLKVFSDLHHMSTHLFQEYINSAMKQNLFFLNDHCKAQ